MKKLILVVLLALAPLSWGEDVWYCVEEHVAGLVENESSDSYELQKYGTQRFTLKYEAVQDRLALAGKQWGDDNLYFMQCAMCAPTKAFFDAVGTSGRFSMKDGRFFYAATGFNLAKMTTGTCTKF